MEKTTKDEDKVIDAVQELTKSLVDVIKEIKSLKETVDKHFKAGRF